MNVQQVNVVEHLAAKKEPDNFPQELIKARVKAESESKLI